jgi:hypothetical protein
MAYLLKAWTVELEKEPLLENGSDITFVSRQRPRNKGTTSVARKQILNNQEYKAAAREQLDKHIPVETDTHTRMNGVVWAVRDEEEDNWSNQISSVHEAANKTVSWKWAMIQRGLEPGGRGIALVRSRYQETSRLRTLDYVL